MEAQDAIEHGTESEGSWADCSPRPWPAELWRRPLAVLPALVPTAAVVPEFVPAAVLMPPPVLGCTAMRPAMLCVLCTPELPEPEPEEELLVTVPTTSPEVELALLSCALVLVPPPAPMLDEIPLVLQRQLFTGLHSLV